MVSKDKIRPKLGTTGDCRRPFTSAIFWLVLYLASWMHSQSAAELQHRCAGVPRATWLPLVTNQEPCRAMVGHYCIQQPGPPLVAKPHWPSTDDWPQIELPCLVWAGVPLHRVVIYITNLYCSLGVNIALHLAELSASLWLRRPPWLSERSEQKPTTLQCSLYFGANLLS